MLSTGRRIASIACCVILGVCIALVILRFTRVPPPPPLVAETSSSLSAAGDSTAALVLERYTGMHVVAGNDVQALLNGDQTYPPLWRDLRAARRTITLQSYYGLPGRVADTLRSILVARAAAGVRVLVLLDAFGSAAMPRAWLADLRQRGVAVAELRTFDWSTLHNAANRSHVRAVVIDGRIGYTGGFGIADYWLGDGRHPTQWRESNVRIEGAVVAELQAAFGAGWVEATGELLSGEAFFPHDVFTARRGPSDAGLFFSAPTVGSTSAERFLALMILSARRRLYITNSYFVPDADFRRLLVAAAARGVDVRVLTTSAITDVKTTWLAGRYHYGELLAAGIRVFEYQPAMMHAKTIVVDGTWSSIGSMNFDNRSLAFNDEVTLVAADRITGARMEAAFLDDQRHSTEITPASYASRSWFERFRESAAILLSRVL